MDKEQLIIDMFKNPLNGDDGAVLEDLVVSKDLFVQGSHFKLDWLSAYEIGFKAMRVNLSDAIAMNATPKYALVGLGVPKNLSISYIKELCSGLKKSALDYGVQIIGGDTIKSDKIIISITILSYLQNGRALGRIGLKLGDYVCFTGSLGESLRDLKILMNGGKIGVNSKFKKPVLRQKFMQRCAKFMRCAMDISDGLASDLPKLCFGFNLKFVSRLSKVELRSGEEYELLFGVSPRRLMRVKNEAKKCRLKLTILAKTKKGRYKTYGKFTHF